MTAVSRLSWSALVVLVLPAFGLGACMLLDVRRTHEIVETQLCVIEGRVDSQRSSTRPLIVVLARGFAQPGRQESWSIVDHHVSGHAGRWIFTAPSGRYAVAAFEDTNADYRYQRGEPFAGVDAQRIVDCNGGQRIAGMPVPIPAASPLDARAEIAIEEMQARSATEQLHRTIGQVTVVGELAALNDPRFKLDDASSGLWRPIDYLITSPPGIYFLEPYDPRKTPVLFVHGINGTPANFTFLIGQVDRSRFQSWIYHYPSGVQLNNVADHLDQTMAKLELRYGVARYAVVAHSMGGLVARGFIQRRTASARRAQIPQFVSIATPWAGHDAARMGVSFSPAVVNVWNDMVPGSAYIETVLAQPLPAETEHHLLFTFLRSGMSLGESSDGTVTIASQLDWRAQAGAVQRYGFNESHDGVLEQANVARLLNAILAGTKASPH